MKEILGFIVLTGPLFLIVLWLPVCLGLGIWAGRKLFRNSNLAVRCALGVLIFLMTLVAPVADEIIGRIYLNHLCETEAVPKVYQAIELPAEYWDENGEPKFYDKKNGNFTLPPERFATASMVKKQYLFNIRDRRTVLRDKATGEILGERPRFSYGGGWLLNNFTSGGSRSGCGLLLSRNRHNEYIMKQYKPIKGDK